eukprot:432858_1
MGSCMATVNSEQNKPKKNASLLTLDDSLLVYGYIRSFEISFRVLIPDPVYFLCYKYATETSIIYLLSSNKSINPNWLNAVNLNDNKLWKCNISELNNPTKLTLNAHTLNPEICAIKYAGLTTKHNMKLPTKLHHKMIELYQMKLSHNINIKNNYNLIFKCGGVDIQHCCNAIILNETQFHSINQQEMFGFNWSLPNLTRKVEGNLCIFMDDIYSKYYGLLSIGGYEQDITFSSNMYYLPFNDDLLDLKPEDTKWETLCEMNKARTSPAGVIIDNNKISKKLIVIGGYNGQFMNSVEVYNYMDNKWSDLCSMNRARTSSAIIYHNSKNMIYVGGGYNNGSLHCVEAYDIYKNKWYEMPSTQMAHDDGVFWLSDNENILCITSVVGNTIEKMDLREGKKWNIEYFKTLHKVFDAMYVESAFGMNRFCV